MIMVTKTFYSVRILLCLFGCLFFATNMSAEESHNDYFDLDLKALSQLIVSASKQEEKLFDAPMAANVITGEQILKSGATSIPEALRLVPGVIVREITSGNYDVHVRGLDNVPPNSFIGDLTETDMLIVLFSNGERSVQMM